MRGIPRLNAHVKYGATVVLNNYNFPDCYSPEWFGFKFLCPFYYIYIRRFAIKNMSYIDTFYIIPTSNALSRFSKYDVNQSYSSCKIVQKDFYARIIVRIKAIKNNYSSNGEIVLIQGRLQNLHITTLKMKAD